MTRPTAILVTVLLAAIVVAGDYFIKSAAEVRGNPIFTRHFVAGFCIYSMSAFGWVFVMRTLKLAHIGVFFSISTILFLALIGRVFFKEELNTTEYFGLAFAIASIVLLYRIA